MLRTTLLGTWFAIHGILASPPMPSEEVLEPRYFKELGAKRTLIRYGPWTAPPESVNMGMKIFSLGNMTLPCRDCYIYTATWGLEFEDGSYANANTSMWLHHSLLLNRNRRDSSCPRTIERSFAGGNERVPVDFSLGGTQQHGYYIGPNDVFLQTTELMNTLDQPQTAVVSIDWSWVPASSAPSFRALTPVWVDITGPCGSLSSASEFHPPHGQPVFSATDGWTSTLKGPVSSLWGHLHDGGMELEVQKNGAKVCTFQARYGESPGYVDPNYMEGMDMGGHDDLHISSYNLCPKELGETVVGDAWTVTARYNMTEHHGMMEGHGHPAGVMGIAVLMILE